MIASLVLTRRALAARAAGLAGSTAVAGVLAACGSTAPAGPSAPQAAGLSGKIHLYVRNDNPVETQGQTDVLIPTFKKVAPNVEVVHDLFVAANADDTYTLKLYTLFAAGTPPDVWGFGQNYVGFWARGMVKDITPFINRDKVNLDQFHTGLPDRFKIHGKYYGLPQLTTFGTLLFYNKLLFDNAGLKYPPVDWDDKSWTYEAMLDVARKLTKDPGESTATYGLAYSVGAPHGHAWLWGGDAFRPEHWTDGIAQSTLLDSPESIDGHQFVQDIRWRYQVRPRDGKDPTSGISFSAGRYGMEINGGWNFWGYSTIKDFKWAVAAVPAKVTNKQPNYNDFWEIGAQSTNPEAAWAFVKHVTTPEVQREYSKLTGTPPTTKAAMDVWYQRYEYIMPRADLEKVTQGAINPKRSAENADHLIIDWSKLSSYYSANVNTPLVTNQGTAKDILTRAKTGYDAIAKEIYETYKGKTPT